MNPLTFISQLFGGGTHTEKVINMADTAIRGVGNFIDVNNFTDQEKSQAEMKKLENYLDYVKSTMVENSIRSITRRWLAYGITGFVIFWASIAMVFAMFGKKEIVQAMIDVVGAFQIGWAFAGVCALYFGVSFIRK